MTLSAALRSATSSLRALQTQTSINSTNIANAQTPGATRKYANVVTNATGNVEVASIGQAQSAGVFANLLSTTASTAQWTALQDGLDKLAQTVGDTTDTTSPAALIGTLTDKLSDLAATPSSYDLARAASAAAKDVATGLNQASKTILSVRQGADDQLIAAAADMNQLLAKIEALNKQVVAGTTVGSDVTDLVDERNRNIQSLSEYVDVTVRTRNNNDVVLYTDSGVTLFETNARKVEYAGGTQMDATVKEGAAFKIDGTTVTGSNASMPLIGGKIAGLVTLRDKIATTYQTQIDEVARSLVAAFAESDQAATPTLEDKTGVFGNSNPIAALPVSLGTLDVGTSLATTIAAGDKLSFQFTYGDKVYNASHVYTAAEAANLAGAIPTATKAATYESILQSAVDTAFSTGGSVFGAGKVTADVDPTTGAISLTPQGAGVYMAFSLSGVVARTNVAGKTGGVAATALVTGTTATPTVPAAATASGTASTAATLAAGNFSAVSLIAGDTLSFDIKINGKTYSASGTLNPVPGTATAYAAALQTMIDTAVAGSDGTVLGAGKIVVAADGTGAISIATSSTGANQSLQLSNAAVGRPASTAVANFSAGSIAVGDLLTFDLAVNGATYKVSHTFTSVPADGAALRLVLQNAINSATAVPSGVLLGSGKVVASDNGSGTVSLATVAGGTNASLQVSNVTAGLSTFDPNKSGGLVGGAAKAVITGLAGTLSFAGEIDGNPQILRDGGINGTDYKSNTANAGGYNARINGLIAALGADRNFSAGVSADPTGSIADFAASSISWLQGERSTTKAQVDYQSTLLSSTQKTLSSETGISMDDELTQLIQLERSYQASSKIISTVDAMLQSLMQAIG